MPLVIFLAELIGAALCLDAAISNRSFAQVAQGKPLTAAPSSRTAESTAVTGGATAGSVSGQVGEVTPSMLASIGQAKGWTGAQLTAWMGVIEKESGGSPTATNSGSGAYGIAQFIEGASEYGSYGGNSTTVTGQLTAMANYIEERYGTPAAALAHEDEYHWY